MTEMAQQWAAIRSYCERSERALQLADLFEADDQRYQRFSFGLHGLWFDFSKQRVEEQALDKLLALAERAQVSAQLARLVAGRYENPTEKRLVRHTAMRWPQALEDREFAGQVLAQQEKMSAIVTRLQSGQWLGATGKVITDVVNLGVGGSDLGPRLGVKALAKRTIEGGVRVYFASSMDGSHLEATLGYLNPETTLFIVASKSFGTIDTLANLATARAWLGGAVDQQGQLQHHLVGVSSRADKMTDYGIPAAHQLPIDESIGGRFSVWSAIGLPLALAVGLEAFQELLDGARAMDKHALEAPYRENIPVLLALLGVWNRNALGIANQVCLPYDGALSLLMPYLQQLEMESNGKSATIGGGLVTQRSNPLVWGGLGTDGQHAFFQWLHQGTDESTADFIAIAPGPAGEESDPVLQAIASQKQLAYANCVSQSRLLAFGDRIDEADLPDEPCYAYPGNTPSNTLVLDELTPFNLGMLLAAYEHKVFVQSLLWEINAFDQPGVELGKTIARSALEFLQQGGAGNRWDSSTRELLKRGGAKVGL